MHIFSILLVGIVTNLDNLVLGAAFGLKRRHIPIGANAIIALLSGLVTWIFGYLSFLLAQLDRWPNYLGGALLILLGLWSMRPGPQKQEEPESCACTPPSQRIAPGQALMLGAALAVNCLPVALGAGLTGIAALPTGLCVAIFSFLSVGAGNYLGVHTGLRLREDRLNRLSGLGMAALGILEMFV